MRAVRHLAGLLLICTGLVLVPGSGSASPASSRQALTKPDPHLLQQLRSSARGSVSVAPEDATKRAGFITAGRNGDLLAGDSSRPVDKAAAFIATYGALVGVTDPSQLQLTSRDSDRSGTTVTYEQVYRGVPVFGGMLRAHLDEDGNLTAVNGSAVPNLSLSVTPRLSRLQAGQRAVSVVKADPPTSDTGEPAETEGIRAVSSDLVVYRTGLVRGETGDNYLANLVEVTNRANIRDIVILDAGSGKLLNRYSLVDGALRRKLYEGTYRQGALVWREGKKFPGKLSEDQQNIVRASGEAYWFFENAFGRDSYDGDGHVMSSVNNDPRISCPNANWNGATTNYCNGVTSDDVVAHEWGHAYTEYTSRLIYQWQPGALNESYSDIWGETVDLINGRMDSDEGDITAHRPVGVCSTHSPATPVVDINSPESIAKTCEAGAASFGPQLNGTGVTSDVVQALDADSDGSGTADTPTNACSPLTNPAAVAGKIALVDRGACPFTVKVKNAQDAGAVAVLVGDNVEETPSGMSGSDPTITIASVRIRLSDRNLIVDSLTAGNAVNVTMRDQAGARFDSYRWLMGEDSSAFGGAIRDMWAPTCHGDPGKVSDAQYFCAADDAGGVHSNSGVPNHGYALLVDGTGAETYNGRRIKRIGLTKAAHIYWRAQTDYQTPTTDFADHADSLEAACGDLVGKTVKGLSTAGAPEQVDPPAPLPDRTIRAADCAEVSAMIDAVELRAEPTQCNFRPLLAKDAPGVCGPGTTRNVVWSEDFSDGLAGWTLGNQGSYQGWPGKDWSGDATLPDGRDGRAAFAEELDGACGDSLGDVSGVMRMQSQPIVLPELESESPTLAFEHYVATEAGFDGGNLKVSVNGGPFDVVPATAYTFNAPTTLETAADGNTNPLAGEEAFTGTDGGQVTGSWGQSQIDLTRLQVKAGDTIALRFDFGMDGCGNLDGWYVDDVTVSICEPDAVITGRRRR